MEIYWTQAPRRRRFERRIYRRTERTGSGGCSLETRKQEEKQEKLSDSRREDSQRIFSSATDQLLLHPHRGLSTTIPPYRIQDPSLPPPPCSRSGSSPCPCGLVVPCLPRLAILEYRTVLCCIISRSRGISKSITIPILTFRTLPPFCPSSPALHCTSPASSTHTHRSHTHTHTQIPSPPVDPPSPSSSPLRKWAETAIHLLGRFWNEGSVSIPASRGKGIARPPFGWPSSVDQPPPTIQRPRPNSLLQTGDWRLELDERRKYSLTACVETIKQIHSRGPPGVEP